MDFTTIQALELLKEDDISMKVNKKTETESTRDLNLVQKCSNESKTEAVYMETSPT
ncbi:12795_t:CDS:1, partial [Dentiscutata heterogama]